MREIKVYFKGDDIEFTTVYWQGTRDSLEDIKDVLITEDDYPDNIELKEVVDEEVFW